jgi:lipoprotein-anchoring transpeptidase ErfK/SrfK
MSRHLQVPGLPRSARLPVLLACLVVLAALTPAAAFAVTIQVPADVLGTASPRASLSATEGPGIASLVLDGAVVRSAEVSAGQLSAALGPLRLPVGSHRLSVSLRSAAGVSVSPVATVVSWAKPMPPVPVSPAYGYSGATCGIVAKAGPATTRLAVWVNGVSYGSWPVTPGQTVRLATATMAAGRNTIRIDATNPVATTTGTFSVKRLDFPWPTCIVVDKSEYKLYWVRDGALIKVYPVAIGKASTPTPERVWKVGVKYVYNDWGVYGPRRLRLFRKVGSDSYQYTGYGIHGTNEEWVIGTMASHGCIRMYNRDVIELYPQVPMGTMVQTRE